MWSSPKVFFHPWIVIVRLWLILGWFFFFGTSMSIVRAGEVDICELAARIYEETRLDAKQISPSAWELGNCFGREETSTRIEGHPSELPLTALLETPIPDLQSSIPGVMAISNQSKRSFERGYKIGVFQAIDRAVSLGQQLPQGMQRSDLHRRKLALLSQWADEDLIQENQSFERLGVMPTEKLP